MAIDANRSPLTNVAAVNNNYAVQAGLDPVRDSIIKETIDGPWVNILAVREADKDKPWNYELRELR